MKLPKFLLPKICCLDEVPEGEKCSKGKKQLWQPSCRNCRGVRIEKKGIVAAKLLKIGGKKERKRIVATKLPKL